jgi:DNA-binding response OmpR family regulator
LGVEVIGPAGRVEQALALLKDDKVDAAVLDINLHGERSFRVAERLAQTGTPFIFLSGYTEAEIPPNFREGQLMTKPVDTNILCQCLDALLTPSP